MGRVGDRAPGAVDRGPSPGQGHVTTQRPLTEERAVPGHPRPPLPCNTQSCSGKSGCSRKKQYYTIFLNIEPVLGSTNLDDSQVIQITKHGCDKSASSVMRFQRYQTRHSIFLKFSI